MTMTDEQESKFYEMLLLFGEAYFDSHGALLSGDTQKFSELMQKEVKIGKALKAYVESL